MPEGGAAGAALRLARWLRLSAIDAAITVAIVAWAIGEAVAIDNDVPMGGRVAFAVAVSVPMALRNRFPGLVLIIASVAFVIDMVTQVLPLFAVTPIQLLPLATYAFVSVGGDRRVSGFVAFAAVLVPPVLFVPLVEDAPVTATDVISLIVVQTVASGAGWAVRLRREEAEIQAARLRRASAAGDAVVRHGLEEERARIARELRAIVARGLAAMEEGFAAATRASAGAPLAAVAGGLQRRSASVMAELQRLLGVLHDVDPGVARPVSAEEAIEGARARGWVLEVRATAEAVPGATLASGRVVEEVLAGPPPGAAEPAHAHVRVTHDGDGLRVRIGGRGALPPALDDPVSRGSIRERVRLHGGTVRFVRRSGRWRVDVRLPGAGAARAPVSSHLLGDIVVVGTASLIVLDDATEPTGAGPLAAAVLGGLVFVLPLALRRRAPLAVSLVLAVGLVVLELTDVLPTWTRTPIIVALLGAGTAAMHIADRRTALAASAAVAVSAVTVNLFQLPPGEPYTDTPIILFMVVMAYAFGRLVRENMERTQDAREGEELVEAEQASRLRDAIDDERRAVARDLHDVVAHGVSLAGVLAGAAQAQAVADPRRARQSLESARGTVAQVRVEVQRLTAALGGDDPAGPPVDLSDLAALVDAAARGGQAVTLVLGDGVAQVPPGVASSAYRIVQESLTNARKHARGAPVVVEVVLQGRVLVVRVRNGAAAAPGGATTAVGLGRGLPGMRERARLLGGELDAAPVPGGGFEVRGRLPFTDDAAAG